MDASRLLSDALVTSHSILNRSLRSVLEFCDFTEFLKTFRRIKVIILAILKLAKRSSKMFEIFKDLRDLGDLQGRQFLTIFINSLFTKEVLSPQLSSSSILLF